MIKRIKDYNKSNDQVVNPSKRMKSGVHSLSKNKKQVDTETPNIRIPVTKTTTQTTSSRNTASPTEPSNYSPIGSACGNDVTNSNPNTDSGVHDSPNAITTTDIASAATNGTSNVVSTENQSTQRKCAPRGPNKCANLQGNAKTMVMVNNSGQPKCRNARKYSSYLGLLARDPKLIPLDLEDWRKFLDEPTEETRFTFEGPTSPREWTMDKLNHCLRSWRTKLKAKKYTVLKRKNVPVEDLIKQPDYRVDPDQWKGMVKKWESPEGQALSEKNAENRSGSKMAHHLGTKSFARLREEKAEIRCELNNLPLDCDFAHERKRIYQEKLGDDKRGYRRTFRIGVKTQTTGTSKQKATEAMLMVEAERQKRQALEDEIAAEKLKRIELENELVIQAEKRKELEQAVDSEKEKREVLADKVDKLSEIVLLMQGNGGQIMRI